MALLGDVIEPGDCGIVVRAIEEQNDLSAAAVVRNIAYGQGHSASEADVTRLRSTVEHGGVVMCAHYDGAVIGAGLFTAPQRGLAEVAAVGVLPEFRRRGVALALTAQLSSTALSRGARPFLQTESMNEQRLYGRIGYTRVGELATASLTERQP